jgi:hypothetical protein
MGTTVFLVFAAITLVVCIARGVVPIFGFEALVWLALAALWQKKELDAPRATWIVLALATLFAAGNGYSVGRSAGYAEGYNVAEKVSRDKIKKASNDGLEIGHSMILLEITSCALGSESACEKLGKQAGLIRRLIK